MRIQLMEKNTKHKTKKNAALCVLYFAERDFEKTDGYARNYSERKPFPMVSEELTIVMNDFGSVFLM